MVQQARPGGKAVHHKQNSTKPCTESTSATNWQENSKSKQIIITQKPVNRQQQLAKGNNAIITLAYISLRWPWPGFGYNTHK